MQAVVVFFEGGLGNLGDKGIEQLANTAVLCGAGVDDRLNTKALESVQVVAAAGAVNLVDDQEDGLLAFKGQLGNFAVFFGNSNVGFDNYPDDIGAVGSLEDLFLDGELEVVFGVLHTSGVYHPEVLAAPACFGGDTIAGSAWLHGYNGFTALKNSVKKAGLANVCTAYNSHNR